VKGRRRHELTIGADGLRRRLHKQFTDMPIRPGRNSAVMTCCATAHRRSLPTSSASANAVRTAGPKSPPPATRTTSPTASSAPARRHLSTVVLPAAGGGQRQARAPKIGTCDGEVATSVASRGRMWKRLPFSSEAPLCSRKGISWPAGGDLQRAERRTPRARFASATGSHPRP
jgi:hypothetical protein